MDDEPNDWQNEVIDALVQQNLPMLQMDFDVFYNQANAQRLGIFWAEQFQNIRDVEHRLVQRIQRGIAYPLYRDAYTADLALTRDVDRHTRMILPYGVRRLIMEQIGAAYANNNRDSYFDAPARSTIIPDIYLRTQRSIERISRDPYGRPLFGPNQTYGRLTERIEDHDWIEEILTDTRGEMDVDMYLQAARRFFRRWGRMYRQILPQLQEENQHWQANALQQLNFEIQTTQNRYIRLLNGMYREAYHRARQQGDTETANYYASQVELPQELLLLHDTTANVNLPTSDYLDQRTYRQIHFPEAA